MSPFWTARDVVLPQAARMMVPPFVNYGVQLLKDTSLDLLDRRAGDHVPCAQPGDGNL